MELTEHQKKCWKAFETHGSITATAKALKMERSNLKKTLNIVKRKMASQGYSPEHGLTRGVPEGFKLSGYSTLGKNEDGETTWFKVKEDRERQEQMMREAVEALCSEIKPTKPIKPPKQGEADLLNAYVITDYHLGMKAWAEETGDDWDTKIAEDMLYKWFSMALETAPKAQQAILIQLGDWLHYDGMDAVTPQSGHLLDADTRFQKMVRVTIRAFRRIITDMLNKYQSLHIIMAEGNHDLSASAWLREMFAEFYREEPRVTVDISPDPYYCHEFGNNSIFAHHGHKRRMADIDRVFTAKFRDVFGRTKYSHAHLGHLHHQRQEESQLMLVEQHRTLAAPDAYASRGGWISGRSAKVITYHREFGKVGEVQISPEMVK